MLHESPTVNGTHALATSAGPDLASHSPHTLMPPTKPAGWLGGQVSIEQLDRLAALAPARPTFHPSRRAAAESITDIGARIDAYLATVPGAVSGDRGHDRTFYVANRLVRGFALTPDAAFPFFANWNLKCDPPWSERDLMRKLDQADKQPGPRGFLLKKDTAARGSTAKSPATKPTFTNFVWDEVADGETMRKVRSGRGGQELVEELVEHTGGWPRRVGRMLFARDRQGGLWWMKSVSELFAWIDWQYRQDGGRGFEWAAGPGCLTQTEFLDACRMHCEAWDQVELYPHHPPIPGHFYHHPEIPTDSDGSALSELVSRFEPAEDLDHDLIRLFFLTLVWGGPPRKRPLFVFESVSTAQQSGCGSGKTTVALVGSQLVGGLISISPKEQLRDMQTRLLSPGAMTKQVALIDNLKTLRFSDSDIEGLITTNPISGRQMYTGEGQRPNTLTWVVTSNKPSLSKDLAQRAVIVRVKTPLYGPKWEKSVTSFIEEKRWQIIADCFRELQSDSRLPGDFTYGRWAEWEHDVLGRAPDPLKLSVELTRRRGQLDDDDEIASDVRATIIELLSRNGFKPDTDVVLIPSRELFETVVRAHNGKVDSITPAMRWLYSVGVTEMKKNPSKEPYAGGIWRPTKAPDSSKLLNWADRKPIDG